MLPIAMRIPLCSPMVVIALAWLMFLIILLLTGLVFRSSIRWVYYEGGLQR